MGYINGKEVLFDVKVTPITIDQELNADSTNAIANQAVAGALGQLNDRVLTLETATEGPIEVDEELDANSPNPVSNRALTAILNEANGVISQLGGTVTILQEGVTKLGKNTLPDVTTGDNGKILQVENGKWTKADAPTGGANITVDSEFSDTSENPVQNKVITAAMGEALGVLVELQSGLSQGEQAILFLNGEVTNLKTQMGDIETALDNIIAMQNSYIGGDA